MGTWNNLQEGFTVNERLPDTLVDVAVCNVYFSVANIHWSPVNKIDNLNRDFFSYATTKF
ncbi:hypothetical protein MZK40_00420 [Limosilactobacillus fermentum]|nr:hypothetical protein [Limosilactobacillus fermentum]